MQTSLTLPQAVLFGLTAIACAFVVTGGAPKAVAQRVGPFMLEHHSNPTAAAGVFRLDTVSGEVSYCHLSLETGTSPSKLTCTQATK